eukprot:1402271-Prymnesium_polylepis.1
MLHFRNVKDTQRSHEPVESVPCAGAPGRPPVPPPTSPCRMAQGRSVKKNKSVFSSNAGLQPRAMAF